MVFYTTMDLHNQVGLYMDKFGLDLDGKKISECIEIIRGICPRLHNDDELREFALNNLKQIENKFGFKALRLFMYDVCKQDLLQSFVGKNRLQEKYEKLLKDIKCYHNEYRDKELSLTLDVYVYYKLLEDVYNEEYGVLRDWNSQLYSVMKTIDISNYNSDVVEVLNPYVENLLHFCNGKYYLKQDLKDPEILKMLYEHIGEESFDEMLVKDYNICTEYDGYGNEYWLYENEESWVDEDGYHYRSWGKSSTIDDYKKVGLPNL